LRERYISGQSVIYSLQSTESICAETVREDKESMSQQEEEEREKEGQWVKK
jgi:hypothetical protein